MDNKVQIVSISNEVIEKLFYKDHAVEGVYYLTGTNPAPTGKYYGFIVTGDNTVISSITYIDPSKQGGDITQIGMNVGMYYAVPGLFSTITLTSGNIILLRKQ